MPTVDALEAIRRPTPFLALDLDAVASAYTRLRAALPGVRLHYAVKCNPEPAVLRVLHDLGGGFEIASSDELSALLSLGVDPGGVLYSNPVRPPGHTRAAYRHGVRRFAADSLCELGQLAEQAPGAAVYVRIDAADPASRVPLAGKFGVDPDTALGLLLAARAIGLQPVGLTFHVGSQSLDPGAYTRAIELAGEVLRRAARHGLRLELLDVGGGFPARYAEDVPPLVAYGHAIAEARARLPYPVEVVAEPGRALVAEAGVLAASVIGVAERGGRRWVHLDVGAFNGLMESLETRRELRYPLRFAARRGGMAVPAAITGPTCDSEDTMLVDVPVPAELAPGDRVYVGTAGAYTTAYASRFNGFAIPPTVLLGSGAAGGMNVVSPLPARRAGLAAAS